MQTWRACKLWDLLRWELLDGLTVSLAVQCSQGLKLTANLTLSHQITINVSKISRMIRLDYILAIEKKILGLLHTNTVNIP